MPMCEYKNDKRATKRKTKSRKKWLTDKNTWENLIHVHSLVILTLSSC